MLFTADAGLFEFVFLGGSFVVHSSDFFVRCLRYRETVWFCRCVSREIFLLPFPVSASWLFDSVSDLPGMCCVASQLGVFPESTRPEWRPTTIWASLMAWQPWKYSCLLASLVFLFYCGRCPYLQRIVRTHSKKKRSIWKNYTYALGVPIFWIFAR